jgi:hypothetical protein
MEPRLSWEAASCEATYSRISQNFMDPKGSLQSSQKPYTGPYPELDQSRPYHRVVFF